MKIQKPSLVEIVIDRIKVYIAENNLQPGDKFLTEKELIQKLNVSRTVVREATIALHSIGILTVKPGGGMYIASSKFDGIRSILTHHYETYGVKVKELLEIRKVMELGALRLIIENDMGIDVEGLTKINDDYKSAIQTRENIKELDASFHNLLIMETKNESFVDLSTIINQYFVLTKIDITSDEQGLLITYKEHQRMIQALENKDLEIAQTTMTQHFRPVFEWIRQEEKINNGGN